MLLKDIISGDQLSGLYKILLKILLITVLTESGGAVALYYSLDGYWAHKIQDSIFHSISAFCNAGFSPYPQGLYTELVRKNYLLHLIICGLIILGGIGFPVLLNFYQLLKHLGRSFFNMVTGRKREHKVFPLGIGERLAFGTTIVLLVVGTVFYYLFEKSGSLQTTDAGGRWVVSFFSSVTARTAGFNVVDITAWCYPTVFLVMFLMWIGASPGSTGGGIKTTTLALSLKAVLNFCRGGKLLEIGNREIGPSTLIRVLSVIVLSLFVIFVGFMLLLMLEPEKNPVHLLFESVSAFSTTGLSLVNSAILSAQSKIVLIALMFIGRIGPVILLAGILVSRKKQYYRLPVENVKIT
jgi:Trk-type K+ transport system membrane component